MKKSFHLTNIQKTIILIGVFALAIAFVAGYFNNEIEKIEKESNPNNINSI